MWCGGEVQVGDYVENGSAGERVGMDVNEIKKIYAGIPRTPALSSSSLWSSSSKRHDEESVAENK